MELVLLRNYYPDGTNGEIFLNGKRVCFTIELPWKDNHPQVSCIPEGKYALKKRYSPKFGQHLHVQDVPGRELILLHTANDALKELKGCIAPVSILTGAGKGAASRIALAKLFSIVNREFDESNPVFLILQSKKDE